MMNTYKRAFHVKVRLNVTVLLCLLLAQLVCGIEASAQDVTPRPTVTRATDVFESSSGRISVGSRLKFAIKATKTAQNIVRSGLHVRVFALREDQSRPSPITTIGDCNVFISVVLRIESSTGTEAFVQTLDHSWLNLSDSLNSIVPGKYFVVFEQSGPASEQFRLKASDYNSYFDTGFPLIVETHQGISIEDVRSAYFERREKLGRLRLEIDERSPSVPCYTYSRLVAEHPLDMQISQTTLAHCEEKLDVNATM